MILFSDTNWSC